MSETKKLSNFIPISRDLFEHSLWAENRAFSRFEAWLYLLKEARFEDSKVLDKSTFVEVKRGQVYASLRFLAKAWGWSEKKVRLFLALLIDDSMIKKDTVKDTGQTIITLCNYDKYNSGDGDKDADIDAARTQQGRSKDAKSKNIKNIKREKIDIPIIEKTWREDFEVYMKEVTKAYEELVSDVEFIGERERYHSNLDVRLSLEKSFKDFWGTKAGWKNKKKSRSETLDWKSTFKNALSQKMNQVYKNKNDLFSSQSQVALPTKPQGRLLQ